MIRVFDYEMNEVASIKITLKLRYIKDEVFVKIFRASRNETSTIPK